MAWVSCAGRAIPRTRRETLPIVDESMDEHTTAGPGRADRLSIPAQARRVPVGGARSAGRGRPTIRTVAQRAGVSKSLVSLVMRGADNVSEPRRQAVLRAAAELGYRPNAVARSLVEGRTRLIGTVVADLHNPFYAEFLDGLQDALHSDGLRMLVGSGRWDPTSAGANIETLLELRVDGLVLISLMPDERTLTDAARSVPVVVVGERDVAIDGIDVVADDDTLGGSLAVDHLVRLGHRRIAHVGGTASSPANDRRRGYLEAMRRRGLTEYVAIEPGDFTEDGGYRATDRLLALRPRPTAIFAPNDLAAIGALSAADARGLRVPGDLSVVGYDNTNLSAIRRIALTSIDQPRREMGAIAAAQLSARIARPGRPVQRRLVVPHLVVRGSTGEVPRGR